MGRANCTINARQSSHWRPGPAREQRRRRRSSAVLAGLLDLLPGRGSAKNLALDTEGEQLKQWLMQRGLPQQKVGECTCESSPASSFADPSQSLHLQLDAIATPGSGRGLAANTGIAKGELLLSIPPQLVLTPEAAAQQSCLRDLLAAAPLPAWSVLALWLAEQRTVGQAGEWWPYVRLLPVQTGSVLEWSEEEVAWLRGSQHHAGAAEIRGAAEASWQELQPLLAGAEAAGLTPGPGAFSREALHWAFSVLLSRLVRLPGLADTEALLPWADLLNHGCDAATCLDWDIGTSAAVLRAERWYRAGEELLISYGQKTSGQLLLRWP